MKYLLICFLLLPGCSSQKDKDRISELEKQVQENELIKYRAQYLEEAENKYDRISRIPAGLSKEDVKVEVARRTDICKDGKTRQIQNDNFDSDTIFGCIDGHVFTLEKGAYIDGYIKWKLSLIAPDKKTP
jgi:hypothetical protein